MTVIAGYLGAGKTTLINRLLSEDHGLKLFVMVNDFGAINIDADLLISAEEDTLTLSNGCVCCTMGADLFMAIGDVLDRNPRPDHLIIEASGIADPIKIANAAKAEPELNYSGILTVVDGQTLTTLTSDQLIGPQIQDQIRAADVLAISKVTEMPDLLDTLSSAPKVITNKLQRVSPLICEPHMINPFAKSTMAHPAYVSRSYSGNCAMTEDQLDCFLADRPEGIFRIKGFIADQSGGGWNIQIVGDQIEKQHSDTNRETRMVAIGLSELIDIERFDHWWEQNLVEKIDSGL